MSYNISLKDTIAIVDPYEEDGSSYALCVDPHCLGQAVTLSCPICEAPIEATLTKKETQIPAFYTADSNTHVNVYKIVFQTCDCPVVMFELPEGLC